MTHGPIVRPFTLHAAMTALLPGILALVIGATGWYYLFHAPAPTGPAERPSGWWLLRLRLRRIGGFVLLLLGATFYAAVHFLNDEAVSPGLLLGLWGAVALMLVLILLLAAADIRLTWRIRDETLERMAPKRPPERH